MVEQRGDHIPGLHLAIRHSFYESVPVGLPACPRITSVGVLPLVSRKGVTGRISITGEPERTVSEVRASWFSRCGGNMMQHAFVNRLVQSALLSDEAATPHYRANCYISVRLDCTFIIVLFICTLGIHGISTIHSVATTMVEVRCCFDDNKPNNGLAWRTEPCQPS
jgi:hypothetical protein